MEIVEYLRILRRRWRIVVLCVLAATIAASVATARQTPLYRARVTFLISGQPAADAGTALTGTYLSQQRISSYATLVQSGPTVSMVLARVPAFTTPGSPKISASAIADSVLLTVDVTDPDPRRALAVADAFGEVFPEVVERVERPKLGGPSVITATVIDPAVLPASPVSPRPALNLAFGLGLGALLGVSMALAAASLDTSVKSAEDIASAGTVPMLGSVPYDPKGDRLAAAVTPHSARAEAFRQVRATVQFAGLDEPLRSIVVTSALPGEGKTTLAANLAITLAQSGQRVLAVDADLRLPKLAEYFGLPNAVGLTDMLLGTTSLEEAAQDWGDGLLQVMGTGAVPPNPAEVLGSRVMLELIGFLEQRYDVVIFDSAPVAPVADTSHLAGNTQGTILVVRLGSTSRDDVKRTVASLRAVGVRIIGAVANFSRERGPNQYGYTYSQNGQVSDSRRLLSREAVRFSARRQRASGGADPEKFSRGVDVRVGGRRRSDPPAERPSVRPAGLEGAAVGALRAGTSGGRWSRPTEGGSTSAPTSTAVDSDD